MTILQHACTLFQNTFDRPPYWIASAPGRVNLIGEFTDYNSGFVLPMAIEQRTVVAGAPNGTNCIVIRSESMPEPLVLELAQRLKPEPAGSWRNYPLGIIAGFEDAGISVPGFDAVIASTVPTGAGLSSSAALEVAVATFLEAVTARPLDPVAKALLCQKAEHTFAGVPCGIMDPFIATLARENEALLLDCRSQEATGVPLIDPRVTVLVIDTRVKHRLATSAYGQRREECFEAAHVLGVSSLREVDLELLSAQAQRMNPVVFRRARHVVTEIARTVQAAWCIREGDWPACGELLDASHASLRDDFEVSCAGLDTVVAVAHEIGIEGGVFGCRMTGGGFGGCAIALIETGRAPEIMERIRAVYRERTGIEAEVFTSRPGAGAQLMEV